jgi:hypothetical protein
MSGAGSNAIVRLTGPHRVAPCRLQETLFMIRFISLAGAVGLAALFVAACSGEDTTFVTSLSPLTPAGGASAAAGSGGRAGSGGGGTGGSVASAGTGGAAAGTGGTAEVVDAGPVTEPDAGPVIVVVDAVDAGDAGLLIPCAVSADCDDQNACTLEACVGGFCSFPPAPIGTACGDTTTVDECTQPDTCDDSGVCLANNQPDGTLCADGHCSLTGVCDCAVERVTAVPYQQQWQTTADTEIDVFDLSPCQLCDGTRDHIVVFTAPATATYRFTATSLAGDVELTVFEGDCGATPQNLVCGENIDPDNDDLNDLLDLEVAAGDSVSVVVGEQCEENGSVGTLSIELAPDQP